MSSEWSKQKLSSLGTFDRGKSKHRPRDAAHLYGGPYPFIQTGDVTAAGGRITSYRQTYTEAGLAQSKLWPTGTLCITIAANIAETALLTFPACFPDSVVGFTAEPSKSDIRYIEYVFRTFRDSVKRRAYGSVQENINLEVLRDLEFPMPPLQEQKSIADFLTLFDDRIALLCETNATLEAIAQALFKSWFVDFDPVRAKAEGRQPEGMDATTATLFPDSFEESELGLVPKGWSVVRLGDVTERITKGTTPTTLKRPFVESGINFVKVESITDNGLLLPEKFAYIDDETHCLLGRSQLKADDVLVTIAGTIGRVAVITEDFIPANTNQAVAIVRPNTSKLPSAFVNQFLRLADSKSRMGERVVQAVQANLSLGSLSDMKLVMPPSELVTKLHDLVFDSIESKRNSNQQCIRTLTQLRETLLPRLISGQLRLLDAERTVEEALA